MSSTIFNWVLGRKKKRLPGYSRLRSIPLSEIAPALADQERSSSFAADRDAMRRALLEPPRRPSDDAPLFTTLVDTPHGRAGSGPRKAGVVTITLPDNGGQCVPVFTTPVRAADYIDVLLTRGFFEYLVSSPVGLVRLLRDLALAGTESVALDRCPRCATFMGTSSRSLNTPADLITLWSIVKATELARFDLYMGYALKSAHAGLFEIARQVAFETLAHVGPEDPRPHLLLGQLAIVLGDQALHREAKAFLHQLGFEAWERKLDQDTQSGSLDFASPEFFCKLQHEHL